MINARTKTMVDMPIITVEICSGLLKTLCLIYKTVKRLNAVIMPIKLEIINVIKIHVKSRCMNRPIKTVNKVIAEKINVKFDK